MPPLRGAVRD